VWYGIIDVTTMWTMEVRV